MPRAAPGAYDLLKGLRPHLWPVVIALALMFIEVAVELAYPVMLGRLIDQGVAVHAPARVLLWGGSMLVLALVSFACGISSTFYAADAGQSFARDLRDKAMRSLVAARVPEFQRFRKASLLTRLTGDVSQVESAVFMCLRMYLRAPLIIVGSVVLAVLVDPWLSLPLLIITPVVAWALRRTMARGMQLFLAAQDRLDQVTALLGENLRGVWLIRAFDRKRDELLRFDQDNTALAVQSTAAMRLPEMAVPALIVLVNLCVLAILWQDAAGNHAQHRSGDVIAVLNYTFRILGAFFLLPVILTNLTRARSALDRLSEVSAIEPEHLLRPAHDEQSTTILAYPPAVAFESVVVRYPGSLTLALGPVNFTLDAGRMLAVVGATGSGKSTLLQLLPGLLGMEAGRILLNGRDLREWSMAGLRRGISYVPQAVPLAAGTIREALSWGGIEASLEEMMAAASAAQLHEQIMSLPEGYETRLEQRGGNLSGGQRQRLAVARALLRKPALLLLDDCTSALDTTTEARLLDAIRRLDCTVLFATQKMTVARLADAVLLLEREVGSDYGTHEDLLSRSPTYRRIVSSQTWTVNAEELAGV